MFDAEEVEAISIALSLLGRTGDAALLAAAGRAGDKIAGVLPPARGDDLRHLPLYASSWHELPDALVPPSLLRQAIRDAAILEINYMDSAGQESRRSVKPLGLIYYVDSVVLAAWCGLRRDFRHFRIDRILGCAATGAHFRHEMRSLRVAWQAKQKLP